MVPNANAVNQFVVDRVFSVLVTTGDKAPYEPGWEGQWGVINPSNKPGVGGSIGLAPVQSLMAIPENAILCANPQEGILTLERIKAELLPEMSDKSGVQACVVHTEAVFDPQQGRLLPNLMLFPVGFMAYGDMVKVTEQTVPGGLQVVPGGADKPSSESNECKETKSVPDSADSAPEGSTMEVEGKPADNPAPTTVAMRVEAPDEKQE